MVIPRPTVTIGVPVYNGEAFLAETLDSLLAQTYTDFELIISDNGSADSTPDICAAYVRSDARVRCLRHETNRGAAWNHNVLVEAARGDFFKWNSADDLCAPEFLEKCVGVLAANPATVLVFSQVCEIDDGSRPVRLRPLDTAFVAGDAPTRFSRHIELDHLCTHVYGLMRLDALKCTERIGNFTDSDRVLLAHLALLGQFAVVPGALLYNRHHQHRSTEAYVGWRARTVWFDPKADERWIFPFCTEFAGFARAVAQSPASLPQRVRLYASLARWLWTYRVHVVYEDLLYYPRQWIMRWVPGARTAWGIARRTMARKA